MKLLLFGVSNVGKTTIGQMIAEKLNIPFFDLDDEIKKHDNMTLEQFVNSGTLKERDKKRGKLIKRILSTYQDCVIAVTPMSYSQYFENLLTKEVLSIELIDSVENIFDRLVFSDENDCLYKDDEYKNKHKDYYLYEIYQDILWYSQVYKNIQYKYNINNQKPEEVVDDIIRIYHLN